MWNKLQGREGCVFNQIKILNCNIDYRLRIALNFHHSCTNVCIRSATRDVILPNLIPGMQLIETCKGFAFLRLFSFLSLSILFLRKCMVALAVRCPCPLHMPQQYLNYISPSAFIPDQTCYYFSASSQHLQRNILKI